MPLFSIEPTGIRQRYNGLFDWPNDPHVHVKDFESIGPSNYTFSQGETIKLSATQNRYSFDYYEIWAPNLIVNAESRVYRTIWGYYVSFDPNTEVQLNVSGSITGSNASIVARYR